MMHDDCASRYRRVEVSGLLGRFRLFFFFQAEDGIRDGRVTGVQTCALPICIVMTEPRTSYDETRASISGGMFRAIRSEERRVGKECRSRGGRHHEKKKREEECGIDGAEMNVAEERQRLGVQSAWEGAGGQSR